MFENESNAIHSIDSFISPNVCSPNHSYNAPNVGLATAQSSSKGVPVTR